MQDTRDMRTDCHLAQVRNARTAALCMRRASLCLLVSCMCLHKRCHSAKLYPLPLAAATSASFSTYPIFSPVSRTSSSCDRSVPCVRLAKPPHCLEGFQNHSTAQLIMFGLNRGRATASEPDLLVRWPPGADRRRQTSARLATARASCGPPCPLALALDNTGLKQARSLSPWGVSV